MVELIVVMGLIATLMAIAAPALSRFFGGRSLREESRRFLALTRYARNQSVSRSEPMELWIDPEKRMYGLEPKEGYETEEPEVWEFTLADGIAMDVLDEAELDEFGQATILFWPDGSLDDYSLERLKFLNEREDWVEIARSDFGAKYVVEKYYDE